MPEYTGEFYTAKQLRERIAWLDKEIIELSTQNYDWRKYQSFRELETQRESLVRQLEFLEKLERGTCADHAFTATAIGLAATCGYALGKTLVWLLQ